jgi:peptidoglycan/xylan/chitin deacetylase (PgdA/CDA1 family)
VSGLKKIKASIGATVHRADRFAPFVASARHSLPNVMNNSVAITFDDGPDARFTPAILDVLRDRQAHATFFLVGQRADRSGDLVRRIVAEGHALGSHSETHPDMWELRPSAAIAEFERGRQILEAITGTRVPLVRPPKGWMDLRLALALRAHGFRSWLWNVDPADWDPKATVQSILDGSAALNSGDILLLHDAIERPIDHSAEDRSATVEALPGIIDQVRARGLELVTLT